MGEIIERNRGMISQEIIIDFLQKNKEKEFSQGEIAEVLLESKHMKNKSTARVSAGVFLRRLEEKGRISHRPFSTNGMIPTKLWKFVR